MAQAFGIFGFFISLLAIFFASEVMRRSTARQNKLDAELAKAKWQIAELEGKVRRLDRAATDLLHQRKRQAETLSSLANKGAPDEPVKEAPRRPRLGDGNGRFTPSTSRNSGTG
ncbi:MAG: hypothetical protein JKY92_03930 [Magnetovibrio sp.]|nr:hypothetical protein [Magnetovibrio sp.]